MQRFYLFFFVPNLNIPSDFSFCVCNEEGDLQVSNSTVLYYYTSIQSCSKYSMISFGVMSYSFDLYCEQPKNTAHKVLHQMAKCLLFGKKWQKLETSIITSGSPRLLKVQPCSTKKLGTVGIFKVLSLKSYSLGGIQTMNEHIFCMPYYM